MNSVGVWYSVFRRDRTIASPIFEKAGSAPLGKEACRVYGLGLDCTSGMAGYGYGIMTF